MLQEGTSTELLQTNHPGCSHAMNPLQRLCACSPSRAVTEKLTCFFCHLWFYGFSIVGYLHEGFPRYGSLIKHFFFFKSWSSSCCCQCTLQPCLLALSQSVLSRIAVSIETDSGSVFDWCWGVGGTGLGVLFGLMKMF